MPFHNNKSSPRPARETKSDKKQQEKIRQREKDRQDRANQMAKSIRAKAVAAKQADKRRKEIEKAELAKQRQKDRDEAAKLAKLKQQQKQASSAKLKQEQAIAKQNELDRIADYNRRRGIYQDAIAGMENPEVSPVVQKLLAQTIGAGTAGTVVARKRGGPVGYTKRWQDARKKSKT